MVALVARYLAAVFFSLVALAPPALFMASNMNIPGSMFSLAWLSLVTVIWRSCHFKTKSVGMGSSLISMKSPSGLTASKPNWGGRANTAWPYGG